MHCVPTKGHSAVYWYQQKQNKELQFLIYFLNQKVLDQIDMVKQRFAVEYLEKSPCSLEIQSSEPGDSALYFCSSSPSTVLKHWFLLVHKPITAPAQEAGDALGWKEVTEVSWNLHKPQWSPHEAKGP